MLENIVERADYWQHHLSPYLDRHDLSDSIPYPYDGMEHLFDGKDVLEVGPGRGRQYQRLKGRVRSYSVCDIVALDPDIFGGADGRYVISSYSSDLGTEFDVVHFWYVLHHVRTDELADFFRFLARHLEYGGVAVFNTPWLGNPRGWYVGDGIGTTYIGVREVEDNSRKWFRVLRCSKVDERSNGYVFVLRKVNEV